MHTGTSVLLALACVAAEPSAPPHRIAFGAQVGQRSPYRFAHSPDGRTAVVFVLKRANLDLPPNASARVFDLTSRRQTASWGYLGFGPLSAAFSADGKLLHTLVWMRGGVETRDLSGKVLPGGHGDPERPFHPHGEPVGLVAVPGGLIAWTPKEVVRLAPTGRVRSRLNLPTSVSGRPSPDGMLFAAANGQSLDLWGVAAGKIARSHPGHDGQVVAPCFRADGRQVAYLVLRHPGGRALNVVHLREVASGRLVKTISLAKGFDASHVAVSPDGRWLAVAGPSGVALLDGASAKEVSRPEIRPVDGSPFALEFTRDGTHLIAFCPFFIRGWRLGARGIE